MSKCQRCDSTRIVSVAAHCNDLCMISIGKVEKEGYVPEDLGIGGGDDVEFDLCLDCGQQQGTWPLPESKLERKANGSAGKKAFIAKQKSLLKQHADLVSVILNMVELDHRCSYVDVINLLIDLSNDDPDRIAAGIIALYNEPKYHGMGETVFDKLEDWEKYNILSSLVEYNDDEDDEYE